MPITKVNFTQVKHDAGKIKKYFSKNNIEYEARHLKEKLEKRSIIRFDEGFHPYRKIVSDTGYLPIDNVIRRNYVTQYLMDSSNGTKNYAQNMSKSLYGEDGKLITREISKIKDEVYWSPKIRLNVKYMPDNTNFVETEYRKNGIAYKKIAKKGSPTIYISEPPLDSKINGLVKTQKIRKNYSHLNKSKLKYTETLQHEIEKNGLEEIVTARKTAVAKDGTTYIKAPHNGGNIVVVSVPNVKTTVYKTKEDLENLYKSLPKELKQFLSE